MTAMAASVPGLYVGTSGFSYPTWRPDFYPEGTKPVDFLRFYSERFRSVELNTSAYQLPSEEHFRTWAEQVPPGFRFAVRMPRQITHGSRLGLVGTFCERVRLLGGVCRLESRPGGPTTISIMLPRWQPLVETATAGVAAA